MDNPMTREKFKYIKILDCYLINPNEIVYMELRLFALFIYVKTQGQIPIIIEDVPSDILEQILVQTAMATKLKKSDNAI
jgi:hypothetical protein